MIYYFGWIPFSLAATDMPYPFHLFTEYGINKSFYLEVFVVLCISKIRILVIRYKQELRILVNLSYVYFHFAFLILYVS